MNLISIINRSAFQSGLLSFVILFLISTNSLASPSSENIDALLNRSKSNTLQDCYYFNELYEACMTVEEVNALSRLLNSELTNPLHQKSNTIALARRLSALGQHKKALQALRILHSDSFQKLPASIRSEYFHAIGYIAMYSGNPTISLEYYKKAAKISSTAANKELYQSHLCAIGVAYNANKNPDQAMAYFLKAQAMETQGENRNSLYLSLNIALTEMNLGNLNKAKRKFFEAFPIIKARKDNYAEIRTLGNLGEIYALQDSIDLAINYFTQAQALALVNNQSLDLIRINSGLSEAYEKKGNTDEALQLLKSVLKIEADLNSGVSESLTAIELKNEIQGQKAINSNVRKQRDQEIQLKRYLLVTSVVLVCILVLLIIYIFLFRKKKRHLLKRELNATKRYLQEDQAQFQEIIANLEKTILLEELYKQSNLTLDQVAKLIGTNRSYLSEAINAHYQKTFSSWLNGIRIATAKELLTDSTLDHLSIEGIATTAGFASISTFNSHFKSETGLTPSYFRKNAKNQPIK